MANRASARAANPLRHGADDDEYASAMMRCEGYAPACSEAGECLHEGYCFTPDGAGQKAARRIIADLINGESDVYVRSWLKVALDGIDHHRFLNQRTLDALRYVAVNKRVRAMYGMAE